ncbi:MAG TPA: NYN domain-containing protein [Candidatus Eisenbacteria bacterium]|jgi:cold shock CspA family protein
MIKFMLFIDGTWLYSNTSRLVEASGEPGFVLDFGKLPRVLAEEVGRRLGHDDWTVVRTHLFGSYAANIDPRDLEPVERRLNFFTMLRQQHHYEVEAFPIEFRGKRLRRTDRDPGDPFEPKEKCVDIALATSMLFNAAMSNAYDVAIAVIGDQDFKPVLQSVRRLGKRVAIASINGACSGEYSDPADKARVRDAELLWLEDLLPRLARRYDPHFLDCQSPAHKGERRVETTYYPKRGEKFYCPACREEFARQREAAGAAGAAGAPGAANGGSGGNGGASESATYAPTDTTLMGVVKHKRLDKNYGFIMVDGCGAYDGAEYFFHETDLADGTRFAELAEGTYVDFQVKADPPAGKAPPARNVRRRVAV